MMPCLHPEVDTVGEPFFLTSQRLRRFTPTLASRGAASSPLLWEGFANGIEVERRNIL
jgi:hypothetical protein